MTTPLGFPEPADTEMLADCAKRDRTLAQAVDAYLQAFNASLELTEGDVIFAAGWSHLNGTERTTATKYGPVVMLNMAANKAGAGSVGNELICTLPVGFRPASTKRGLANNANSPRGFTIHPDGRITNDGGWGVGLAALVGSTAFPVY